MIPTFSGGESYTPVSGVRVLLNYRSLEVHTSVQTGASILQNSGSRHNMRTRRLAVETPVAEGGTEKRQASTRPFRCTHDEELIWNPQIHFDLASKVSQ